MPLEIEECRTALWYSRGNITKASQILKISASRLRKFVANSPYLSEEANEAREQLIDIAEDVVYDALTSDDDAARRDAMARFALTNLGGARGYGNSKGGVNINVAKGGKVEISWADGHSFNEPETIDVTPQAAE